MGRKKKYKVLYSPWIFR